ncbi:MAG TPA: hypothetical protein VNG93_04435 [Candidatus Dormibacteraeota bacterium]|nr:hypothetical protein [Candidatus Dormibacteraeota bacterium]
MFNAPIRVLLDIVIHPDFTGLPPSLLNGLQRLADNAAGILLLVSTIGIGVSITLWVVGSWVDNHHLVTRAKSSLIVSALSGGMLYATVAGANYMTALFR